MSCGLGIEHRDLRIIVEKLLPIACTVGVTSRGRDKVCKMLRCADKAVTMCGREIFVIGESCDSYNR